MLLTGLHCSRVCTSRPLSRRMRMQLLAAWTTTLKRIGKRLIAFMLSVFKPVYDEDEVTVRQLLLLLPAHAHDVSYDRFKFLLPQINVLKSIEDLDKADLLRILDFIENTLKVSLRVGGSPDQNLERFLLLDLGLRESLLSFSLFATTEAMSEPPRTRVFLLQVHWHDHEGFVALQERVLALRMILEEAGDKPLEGTILVHALQSFHQQLLFFSQANNAHTEKSMKPGVKWICVWLEGQSHAFIVQNTLNALIFKTFFNNHSCTASFAHFSDFSSPWSFHRGW